MPEAHAGIDYGSDYLRPGEARGGYLSTVSQPSSDKNSSRTKSQTVYRSFQGDSYSLNEHRGRYVNVLVPERFDGGRFFTADHLTELVDRLDELYLLYRDIVSVEPAGHGLLNIAFVPETCGMGCGLLGAKGIEIQSAALNYELIIRELDAGRLEGILVHEMAHNFDVFSPYLHYLPDHAHAWTDFFQYFAAYRYGRYAHNEEAPDDLFRSPVSSAWQTYVTDSAANWSLCVEQGGCEDKGLTANNIWAMPYYRMESLYGAEAMLRSFEFLIDYARRSPVPTTVEEKESLRILSLAHGTQSNIACHMASLKWPVPDDVANELQRLYGASSPLCDDLDRDGFIVASGDCDDTDAARHLTGLELGHNRRDDDCDGLVDETYYAEETEAKDFGGTVQSSLPFEAHGRMQSVNDDDRFAFQLTASSRVFATLCAGEGFNGWASALDANGRFIDRGSYYVYLPGPGCSSVTFDFGDAGSGTIMVSPNTSGGAYSLTASTAADLPEDYSILLSAVARESGGVRLQFDDPQGLLGRLGAEELEFWISGTDIRMTVPYAADTAAILNRSSAPELNSGETYRARVRALANGRPLLPFSTGHVFKYSSGPQSLPQVDSRYSGAWYDPSHNGEGFIVEVLENDGAVVYWFTYDTEGRQRWLTGAGKVDGNRIVVDDLIVTRGGRFGESFNPNDVVLNSAGSLNISFQGCSDALVNYSVDDNGGNQVLTRLTGILGHDCTSPGSPPARDISGSWYDPSHNGEGFVVQQLNNAQASVFWFSYDAEGNQAWMHQTGAVEGDRVFFSDLLRPTGGRFGRSFEPDDVRLTPWGELELQLDCNGGHAVYAPADKAFTSGSQQLLSLTRLEGSGCSAYE
ncbi:MAG: hypothetical protein HKO62_00385 [Gammaproteobacteria bacterium]|nr:hypothetical protein [Gammaproteobacteria bacterium]